MTENLTAEGTYEGPSKLKIQRYFSKEGTNPYDRMKWTRSDVDITDENGNFLFKQQGVEFPEHFSPLARKIVTSRFAYGENGTDERESSLRNIIGRVSETYGKWAVSQGYMNPQDASVFVDEIATIALQQKASFNSPVWFNVGTDKYESRRGQRRGEGYHIKDGKAVAIEPEEGGLYPQTSACFIQSVKDDMDDIMDLAAREARLYKYGSGTGTDLSTLRSSREKLSGGGKPSGPLAYQMFYDRVAGIVKSGGKTRRAAQMKSLKVSHPDILDFIEAKSIEEQKARALVGAGYSERVAAETIAFQNANFSVRVADEFMRAVEQDLEFRTRAVHNHEMDDLKDEKGNWVIPRYKARDLLARMAKTAWSCGDPGIQYDDTINKWHTCPNSDRIKASNPCSEYMFVDDSSCNLASINVMKFRREDKTFDVEGFKQTVKIMTRAMDLNYDNSGFPTEKIADNSHRFRPLGMGLANVGAYIMSLGLAYDSDEGRAVAASLTALLTSTVYETSSEMAAELGAFPEYEKNREPMLKVMEMHRDALPSIDKKKLPIGLENVLDEAEKQWDSALRNGRRHGYRNAQATVYAPTGTIGFMMDCDTKGIEPEILLVQYKKLAEGGTLRMVNQTVQTALETLKYNSNQVKEIVDYVAGHQDITTTPGLKKEHFEIIKKLRDDPGKDLEESKKEFKKLGYDQSEAEKMTLYVKGHETMEGAPHIKEEHLPVFDTSLTARSKGRTIHYMGHIKMMAAVQPFLSGAISKTVNMPEESTEEDVSNAYMEGWKNGLKALAIYRNNSKVWQVVNTSSGLEGAVESIPKPVRRRLPDTRPAVTHHFGIRGGGVQQSDGSFKAVDHEGYFTVGFYPDTNIPGELFITMAKEGSLVSGLMDVVGTLASMALQYGVPFEDMERKFAGMRFDPQGMVVMGDKKNIHTADSIPDYIFRSLGNIIRNQEEETKENPVNKTSEAINKNKINSSNGKNNGEAHGMCPSCSRLSLVKGAGCEKTCSCGYQDFSGCGG